MLEHILIPLDGSTLAERVLPHAIALAEACHSRLSLLHVVYRDAHDDQFETVNPVEWQMRKSEAEAYLKSVQSRLSEVNLDCKIHILEGKPAQQIVTFAHNEDANLIVMSSHGSGGISEWNINSTVQKVLLRAVMPIMIVRAYQEAHEGLRGLTYKRLLMPLDGSKRAEISLPLAKSLCAVHKSTIFLTHIVEEPKIPSQTPLRDQDKALIENLNNLNIEEAQKYLNEIEEQLPNNDVKIIIETSEKPTLSLHNIIDREKIDLVLLSAHGSSGDNRWPYGKIALNFIAFGTTPIIIVQDLCKEEVQKTLAEKYAEESKGH